LEIVVGDELVRAAAAAIAAMIFPRSRSGFPQSLAKIVMRVYSPIYLGKGRVCGSLTTVQRPGSGSHTCVLTLAPFVHSAPTRGGRLGASVTGRAVGALTPALRRVGQVQEHERMFGLPSPALDLERVDVMAASVAEVSS
jgi:hypothetical protein